MIELVADAVERHFVVGLVAARLEQLEPAASSAWCRAGCSNSGTGSSDRWRRPSRSRRRRRRRCSWRRASSPDRPCGRRAAQPSTYFGQWLLTHSGIRKFAEIGSQPRAAASVTPLENGATAVTTIGGCGFCSGLGRKPWPISGIDLPLDPDGPVLALDVVGRLARPDLQHRLIASRNMALRSASRLPNASASDSKPARADAEDEAAVEHVVEHRDLRGDRGRMRVRHVDGAGAELDRAWWRRSGSR